jgi:hypothetical protein
VVRILDQLDLPVESATRWEGMPVGKPPQLRTVSE